MAEALHCLPETITTLLISYTPIQNKKVLKKKMTSKMKKKKNKKKSQNTQPDILGSDILISPLDLVFSKTTTSKCAIPQSGDQSGPCFSGVPDALPPSLPCSHWFL